jgi:hypothetical protein
MPSIPSLSVCKFHQTTAPAGWTKITISAINDCAIRITSGSLVNGGSRNFSTVFVNKGPVTPAVGSLTSASIGSTASGLGSHSHALGIGMGGGISGYGLNPPTAPGYPATIYSASYYPPSGIGNSPTLFTSPQGSGGTHTHPITIGPSPFPMPVTVDFSVKYIDMIIAQRD